MFRKQHLPNEDDLIHRYQTGESLLKLSRDCGRSVTMLQRHFRKRGVSLRGWSAAQRIVWQDRDRAATVAQCSAAWRASRGAPVPEERLRKIARARGRRVGRYEQRVARLLREAGFQVQTQLPVNRYNLDVAIFASRVAVEIEGRPLYSPRERRRLLERTKHLTSAGWRVLYVYLRSRYPCPVIRPTSAVVEHVVALTQGRGLHPAAGGGYRVIRSDGQPLSRSCFHLDGVPQV